MKFAMFLDPATRIKALALCLFAALSLYAQPVTLTDQARAANGMPATGTIAITPVPPFTATDGTVLSGQTITVQVTNGSFSVALEPNLTGTLYKAVWQLYGARPLTDWWAVPVSSSPVNLATVRGAAVTVGYGGIVGNATQMQGYPISVAAPADGQTWRWNASAGQWVLLTFSDQETPAGTMDGSNTTFTLAHSPNPANGLMLFWNGMAMKTGLDYTLLGNTITYFSFSTPQPGDTLLCWYRY